MRFMHALIDAHSQGRSLGLMAYLVYLDTFLLFYKLVNRVVGWKSRPVGLAAIDATTAEPP